jgi:tetratricopeptide (TPR) repeat protein
MTFQQARDYESAQSLWEATARRSPRAWVAWSNLGKLYADARRDADAIAAHEQAWSLEQRVPDTWYNLAMVRARQGRYDEARAMLLEALERTGTKSMLRLDCLIKLSMLAEQQGRMDEARDWLWRALDAAPDYPPTVRWAEQLLRR